MSRKIKTAQVAVPAEAEQTAILEQLDAVFTAPAVEAPKPVRKARKTVAAPLAMVDVLAALHPEGSSVKHVPTHSLAWAVALLSRPVAISSLPMGSYFSLDGRFGTLLELAGEDAKVEWDGKTGYWSSAALVRWASELPIAVAKPFSAAAKASKTAARLSGNGKSGSSPAYRPSAEAQGQAPAGKRHSPRSPKAGRPTLFGCSPTRVVMWLGAQGISHKDAAKVLEVMSSYGIDTTIASVTTFLRSGLKGDRGPVAELTDEQGAEILAKCK